VTDVRATIVAAALAEHVRWGDPEALAEHRAATLARIALAALDAAVRDHERVCGACGATTREQMSDQPRVWRSGGDEPGEDVRAAMSQFGKVATRYEGGGWLIHDDDPGSLSWHLLVLFHGPLVEVTLPQVVTE